MNRAWLLIIFAVAVVSAGLPLWLLPYNEVEVPSIWILPGLMVILPLAVGTRLLELARTWTTVGILTGAMIVANLLRIMWDTAVDQTSHNLWPFELFLTTSAGVAFSLTGCVLGTAIGYVWRRLRQTDVQPDSRS
jgi:hypothetical protein